MKFLGMRITVPIMSPLRVERFLGICFMLT